MRTLALAAALALAGCDARPDRPEPDFYVGDIGVKVDTKVMAWALAPDFPARFERTTDAAARYFGGEYGWLRGWIVVFTDDSSRCPADAAACAYREERVIYVTRYHNWFGGPPAACVEASQLVHEIGHAIMRRGDPCHRDPRWQDFLPVAQELEGLSPMQQNGFPCWPLSSVLDWRAGPDC